ncbi:uncharacterized protein LDX57_012092 [Aspergillus melleus]|uniref:uncharacterized protein n=1 Tax=Aspergillus melleus TaxID=138277 RepID=UPI001E8D3B48|nr:uncharacterized protein LDX57_012092 [Aspergillus melleus]KAH8434445.1 hypothetical protein LDX57_012092 [Aspergillus melleus]
MRLFHGDKGLVQYKNFILYLISKLGLIALQVRPKVSPDHLYLIRAKLGRRLYKLDENVLDHVVKQVEASEASVMRNLQQVQRDIITSEQTVVSGSFDVREDDLKMSLIGCGDYLRDAIATAPVESNSSIFERDYEQRAQRNRHGLPILNNGDLLSLSDFEDWVERMLEQWLRDNEPSAQLCTMLASLFKGYYQFASETYAGCPEFVSGMLLALLELWVAIDKICTGVDPRLMDYSPEIPTDFLEPLLLPQVSQMNRARNVEGYIRFRHKGKERDLPSILEDPKPRNFAKRYFDSSDPLQQQRARIEEHAHSQLQQKRKEWQDKSAEYENILSRVECLEHDWPIDRQGNPYHDASCRRCALSKQASSMRIDIYEWPLPQNTDIVKDVVFELACPAWFASWRDVTWKLLHDFGHMSTREASDMEQNLLNYKKTSRFAVQWGQRITLGSKTKSWSRSHYKHCSFPVDFSDLSRPNAFQFRLLDSKNNSWVTDQESRHSVKRHCIFDIPEISYSHLQYAVDSFCHTENHVIADQNNCHPRLSLHEFIAFGCLRAGQRIQWYNIIRELASAALSLNEESVGILLCQAAWELGTPSPGTSLREAHRVLEDNSFINRLLETLERRLKSIETNWNQYHALQVLVALGLRALSVSTQGPITARAVNFLRRSRRTAMEWCEELLLSLDEQSGLESDMRQSLIAKVGGVCQLTYWVETNHLDTLLSSQDDLYYLARSSVIVFENSPRNWDRASDHLKPTLIRTSKVLHSIEHRKERTKVGIQHTVGVLSLERCTLGCKSILTVTIGKKAKRAL